MQIRLKRLDDGVEIPKRAHPGDAGVDLVTVVDVDLAPGERKLVGTGVAIELPLGSVGLVTPRSGLAARCGLTIVNAPGVVDAGYRGEIKVCLLNTDQEHPISLLRGDRIAQLVVQRVELVDFVEANELSTSERGEGGHGSSGGAGALDAQTLATRYGEQ